MVTGQRSALERLWKDECTIYQVSKTEDPNTMQTISGFVVIPGLEKAKCKLSFRSLSTSGIGDNHIAEIEQEDKLIIGAEWKIPPGCRVYVQRVHDDGTVSEHYFKSSGRSGRFSTHQEIPLEAAERWA